FSSLTQSMRRSRGCPSPAASRTLRACPRVEACWLVRSGDDWVCRCARPQAQDHWRAAEANDKRVEGRAGPELLRHAQESSRADLTAKYPDAAKPRHGHVRRILHQ